METKCDHCGTTSNIMQPGNQCHACQIGIMQPVKKGREK